MGRYPDLGPGVTGVHNKGPVVSEYGFRVGVEGDTTEIIDKDGLYNAELMAMSLAGNDVMTGGTIDGKVNTTHTIITVSGSTQYEVTILVKITEAFAENTGVIATVEFGDAHTADRFGTLSTPASVGETQFFTGTCNEDQDITIKVSGWETDATGEFDYIIVANEV